MKTIIIGFSTRKKFTVFSWLIKFAQNTKYSHAYLRNNSNNIGEYVYQASGLQVNFMGIDTFLNKNLVIEEYEFQITDEDYYKMLKFFIKNAGKPYGIKQIFAISWIMLLKKLSIHKKERELNNDEEWICSELAAVVMRRYIGKQIEGVQDMITPKDLREQIKIIGKKVQ